MLLQCSVSTVGHSVMLSHSYYVVLLQCSVSTVGYSVVCIVIVQGFGLMDELNDKSKVTKSTSDSHCPQPSTDSLASPSHCAQRSPVDGVHSNSPSSLSCDSPTGSPHVQHVCLPHITDSPCFPSSLSYHGHTLLSNSYSQEGFYPRISHIPHSSPNMSSLPRQTSECEYGVPLNSELGHPLLTDPLDSVLGHCLSSDHGHRLSSDHGHPVVSDLSSLIFSNMPTSEEARLKEDTEMFIPGQLKPMSGN